jgi:O-antigen/teichoic acid export membrane protein
MGMLTQPLRYLTEIANASPLRRRLAHGFFWSAAGAVVGRMLGLASSIIVARVLGKASFGALGMVVSTVAMFQTFAAFGLGVTAAKHVAELRNRDPLRAGRILGLSWLLAALTGGLSAAGLLACAPWVASHALASQQLAPLLRAGVAALLFGALNSAQGGALMGLESFKKVAVLNICTGIIGAVLSVAGAVFAGLPGCVWAFVASQIIAWALYHVVLRRESRGAGTSIIFRGCLSEVAVLWRFSLPATLAAVMVGPVNWVCATFLVHQPNGYAEMGIYNAAAQWLAAMVFLPTVLAQAVVPILSERVAQNDAVRSRKILFLSVKLNALLVLPMVAVGSLASPYIMGMYGPDFVRGWPTLVLVLVTAGALALEMPVSDLLVSHARMWTGFLMNLGWALAFIAAAFIWRSWGAAGLAGARLLAYALHGIWTIGVGRALQRGMIVDPTPVSAPAVVAA